MAIAAIMVAILAVLQCSNYKENWYLGWFFLEECDRDQCDFKMAVILAAIFKMAAKMRKISKCSNFNENWYIGFFPHEECDGDKNDLKIASYFFTGTHVLVYVMYQ
jgi:hypothetical protein